MAEENNMKNQTKEELFTIATYVVLIALGITIFIGVATSI